MTGGATRVTSRQLRRMTCRTPSYTGLARVTAVSLAMLVLSAGVAGCEYYASKSSFQASAVQEILATRVKKLEQHKFVPPSPAAPLVTDPRSLPYETERIGREGTKTTINVDLGVGFSEGGGIGFGGDGGGGGGGGGG